MPARHPRRGVRPLKTGASEIAGMKNRRRANERSKISAMHKRRRNGADFEYECTDLEALNDEDTDVAEEAFIALRRDSIDLVLGTISAREEHVLRLRFGLDRCDNTGRTLEEVGRILVVTRERIRQIEAKALRKLRHPSRSRRLRDYVPEFSIIEARDREATRAVEEMRARDLAEQKAREQNTDDHRRRLVLDRETQEELVRHNWTPLQLQVRADLRSSIIVLERSMEERQRKWVTMVAIYGDEYLNRLDREQTKIRAYLLDRLADPPVVLA